MMKLSTSLSSLLAILSLGSVTVLGQSTNLNDVAKSAGKLYFGTETDAGTPEMSDSQFVALASNSAMFGQITPGNSFKWDSTEPSQGQFSFTLADELAAFAEKEWSNSSRYERLLRHHFLHRIFNNVYILGHNCVWYNQLPSWVSSGGFDSATLTQILQDHVTTVVSHFTGQIQLGCSQRTFQRRWNAAFIRLPDTLGQSYIDIALQAARAADPNAKLYINDYNIEGSGAKASAMLSLVQDLKSRNIPLDGIGLQGHFIVGELPSDLQSTLEAFTALGVEVAYTEVDIRMTLPETDALLEQQQKDYQTVVAACMAVENCVGVTTWASWIPTTFSGQGDALPWDENFQTKPAYDGIVAALG
ncbi:endo-1,4-beta xylanase [Dendrothele bispora CBS 962.96]|uniref:Beta-xylanase n=1 Tax=Dendrothele bispora (strain CBS 962.96) TaxID=1314807 RepID=A0A4S8MFY8_DENBC|nr:endo-1,4-beta xylanase [Dendrothele bispora CBS 962.96]